MRKLDLDLFFQMGLLGFFILLLLKSRSYPLESRLYPQIIGGITVILLLFSVVRHLRTKGEKNKMDGLRRKRFYQISLVIFLATVVGFAGGFILSVLCYYAAYAFFQKDRANLLRTLSIGVVLTVLLYFSFGWFMQVPLFRGWLVGF